MAKKKKSNRGGKRTGAGRKPGLVPETGTLSIRHDKETLDKVREHYKGQINALGKMWLDSLVKKIKD